jgi:hypothetical protein
MASSLSRYEMNLVSDSEILLAKNRVIKKVYEMFGELVDDYKQILKEEPLYGADEIQAKISRGENYRGLPYVMLDYPRNFSKSDVFAIRSFFWWGHFFSITLQLEGEFYSKFAAGIQEKVDKNVLEGWSVGTGLYRWEHDFENENYSQIMTGKNYDLLRLSHLKFAKKIPLNEWDQAHTFFKHNFSFLIKILTS